MYLLFIEYGLFFVIGKIVGVFSSLNDFIILFFKNKGHFLLIARLTVMLFGVGTVYVLYRLGRDFFNRRMGLLSALFLSLVMGHIASSQVVKADVPAAFFTVLGFYFICKIITSGSMRNYILSGVFIGLGIGPNITLLCSSR